MRALVVDDEQPVRRVVALALRREGFICEEACDGAEGLAKATSNHFDVVITDLRMPNRNGHSLAVELLTQTDRPLIVVHTAVLEPRLAKDLIARGVDDIVFKPSSYGALAAKIKAMAKRRRLENGGAENSNSDEEDPANAPGPDALLSWQQIEARLSEMSDIMPLSPVPLEVHAIASDEDRDVGELIASIEKSASLAVEMLRLSNSAYYNPSHCEITDLEQAVLRIGRRRIGEVALAANAMASLTTEVLAWMGTDLLWKRGVAAGLAIESLVDRGGFRRIDAGLGLSANLVSHGRVLLATLYPERYVALREACRDGSTPLRAEERRFFPLSHTEVLANLLDQWKISPEIHQPLRHAHNPYSAIAQLPTRLRTQIELVKVADWICRLTVGQWKTWDTLEIPPLDVAKRLGVSSVDDAIAHAQDGLKRMLSGLQDTSSLGRFLEPARQLLYCSMTPEHFDFRAPVFPSLGIELVGCPIGSVESADSEVMLNCLGYNPARIVATLKRLPKVKLAILCDAEHQAFYAEFGRVLTFPCSYGQLALFSNGQ